MSETVFPYARIFAPEPEFTPSNKQLDQLAEFMTRTDEPTPAGYTYLGQFINHDITLELSPRTGKPIAPWRAGAIDPALVANKRSPFLNLDTVYGTEKPLRGRLPKRSDLLEPGTKGLLKLGDTVATNLVNQVFKGKDLPRIPGKPTALIVEPRNDENLAIAQLHVAFIRFHNAIIERGPDNETPNPFEAARSSVIQHYQWIVLHDYLPRVVKTSVLADVLQNGNRFYVPKPDVPYVPLEFSAAAFRMGHSTIRNSYNWNKLFNEDPQRSPATLFQLRNLTSKGRGLTGNGLPSEWVINWNWFFDVSSFAQGQKLNIASNMDTRLASSLGTPFNRHRSLSSIDLYRGRAHRLSTGQGIASRILDSKDKILRPEQIAALLPPQLKSIFSTETPLWFYLLAEAEIEEQGQRLGEVGSRIVVETLVELIRHTTPSILSNGFTPNPSWSTFDGKFGMPQLLKFIAHEDYRELDPMGDMKIES